MIRWPAGSSIQSVLIPRAWPKPAARAWARAHGFHSRVEAGRRYWRLRQQEPGRGPLRTITFGRGIKAVVQANPVKGTHMTRRRTNWMPYLLLGGAAYLAWSSGLLRPRFAGARAALPPGAPAFEWSRDVVNPLAASGAQQAVATISSGFRALGDQLRSLWEPTQPISGDDYYYE